MTKRVANTFKVVSVVSISTKSKRVTLAPVYIGDPEYNTGTELYSNPERNIEILVHNDNTFYVQDTLYYLDFTTV